MCNGVDTSHGNANNSRLGEDGEIGEVFEKQTKGSVLVHISRPPFSLRFLDMAVGGMNVDMADGGTNGNDR